MSDFGAAGGPRSSLAAASDPLPLKLRPADSPLATTPSALIDRERRRTVCGLTTRHWSQGRDHSLLLGQRYAGVISVSVGIGVPWRGVWCCHRVSQLRPNAYSMTEESPQPTRLFGLVAKVPGSTPLCAEADMMIVENRDGSLDCMI
jgi:hypothetical protein